MNCCVDFTESRTRALWSLPQALKACYRAENGRQVYAKNQPAQDNQSSASLYSLAGIFSHAESPREASRGHLELERISLRNDNKTWKVIGTDLPIRPRKLLRSVRGLNFSCSRMSIG